MVLGAAPQLPSVSIAAISSAVSAKPSMLDEAHKRGIRMITDLVMNHTSDTHPWFEESRRHPEGHYGDF